MTPTARSALAALALAVPVLAEVARPELFDGTWGHLVFAASQLLGWLLVAAVVRGAPAAASAASPRGRRVVLLACGLQLAFAGVYGVTAIDGEPYEGSFVLFLLGFVSLLVGGLLWAARLRRVSSARVAGRGLLAVAVLGALAVLVGSDPFHDVLLVSSYAAWVVVGRGFTTLGPAPLSEPLGTPSTGAAGPALAAGRPGPSERSATTAPRPRRPAPADPA